MKNIIFIAPPAAGKGTQSSLLIDKYGYEHISTGDILREEIMCGTDLGKSVKNIIDNGLLVSDDIMIEIIKNKLESIHGKPFILDGFPRTLDQAKSLTMMLDSLNVDNTIAINLELNEEDAMKRALGRLTCSTCGRSYNKYIQTLKPSVDNVCDYCGEKLIERSDDNETSFKKRYDSFLTNTLPIVKYYESINLLVNVDVNRDSLVIFKDIME